MPTLDGDDITRIVIAVQKEMSKFVEPEVRKFLEAHLYNAVRHVVGQMVIEEIRDQTAAAVAQTVRENFTIRVELNVEEADDEC